LILAWPISPEISLLDLKAGVVLLRIADYERRFPPMMDGIYDWLSLCKLFRMSLLRQL
jgi:hypothetical protein